MKYPIYTIFNVIYQLIVCWLLVFWNTYYNDLLIPKSYSEKIGLKIIVAIAEGVLLLLIVYIINRAVLSDTEDEYAQKRVAAKTIKIQLAATTLFVLAIILG